MPLKPHPLTRAERDALRVLLEVRKATLERELSQALHDPANAGTLSLPNRHAQTGEDAVADLESDIDVASVERDVDELGDVAAALARMDQGGYGACGECGGAIGWERLQVQPQARHCMTCAKALERRAAPLATRAI